MLFQLATARQKLTLLWRISCLDSSERPISTRFILWYQYLATLLARSAISNKYGSSCSAHFFNSSSSVRYRAGCCYYHHEHSTDCQGVGASTTMRNQLSFWGPSVYFLFPHYAHPTPGAYSSDARLMSRSQGFWVGKQGPDKC